MADDVELAADQICLMRDDLDFAHAIMRHAVRLNLAAFSFAGLRVPLILQGSDIGKDLPAPSDYSVELLNFEEQLNDRIVSLADNKRMLAELWGFNERSRPLRASELSTPKSARRVVAETAELVNALFVKDSVLVLEILESSLRRRLALLAGETGKVLPFPEARRNK